MIISLQTSYAGLVQDLEARYSHQRQEQAALEELMVGKLKMLEEDLYLVKKALHSQRANDDVPAAAKVKVPEPKFFDGARDAKELENFIWDVEQYIKAAHIPDGERVGLISMYLRGDAKLWWRTRMADDQSAGRPGIMTWEVMKKELKEQFLPCNTSWMARDSLKRLRHTGSVREYVKQFSSLMLEIQNMSEEDRLFNFQSGLQSWAQLELRRQCIKDLPSAMAAAEALVDFRKGEATTNSKDGFGKAK